MFLIVVLHAASILLLPKLIIAGLVKKYDKASSRVWRNHVMFFQEKYLTLPFGADITFFMRYKMFFRLKILSSKLLKEFQSWYLSRWGMLKWILMTLSGIRMRQLDVFYTLCYNKL